MAVDYLERARALEKEAKEIRRAEALFWKSVDERKEEILAHFSERKEARMSDKTGDSDTDAEELIFDM